jgi:hypothetical protein
LAQLAGRPSFGDAVVSEPVKALIFSPDRMRALLIAEAELAIKGGADARSMVSTAASALRSSSR